MADLKIPCVNVLVIDGRLTKDPHRGLTPGGLAWAGFGIAHEDYRKGTAETDFWEVSCFGRTAEVAARLRKGAPVIIEGKLIRERWIDQDTGKEREATRISANRIRELAWPTDVEKTEPGPAPTRSSPTLEQEECPF